MTDDIKAFKKSIREMHSRHIDANSDAILNFENHMASLAKKLKVILPHDQAEREYMEFLVLIQEETNNILEKNKNKNTDWYQV